VALPFFACLVCGVWFRTSLFYRKLFKAKFDVLREFEQQGGLFPAFERESKLFDISGGHWLIGNEECIPIVFAAPFFVIFVYVVLTLLHWL
jgi:hypothetical protein